jgi:flagellar protein FlaF
MQYHATEAYRTARQKTAAPRELEAGLLLCAAADLQASALSGGVEGRSEPCPAVTRALAHNCKLWTVLVTSAMQADCPLPEAIRQSVAELGLFVIARTARAMGSATGEAVDEAVGMLVDINRTVAAGLRA